MGESHEGDAGMTGTDVRDLRIHIHEHVGPLRERVGKIEGQMEVHDRELGMLRQGLDGLRDRIDMAKNEMISALATHAESELSRYDCMVRGTTQISNKLNWIIGVGSGLLIVLAILEFFVKSGILTHH